MITLLLHHHVARFLHCSLLREADLEWVMLNGALGYQKKKLLVLAHRSWWNTENCGVGFFWVVWTKKRELLGHLQERARSSHSCGLYIKKFKEFPLFYVLIGRKWIFFNIFFNSFSYILRAFLLLMSVFYITINKIIFLTIIKSKRLIIQ